MRLVKIIPESEIAKTLKTTIIRYSEKTPKEHLQIEVDVTVHRHNETNHLNKEVCNESTTDCTDDQ